MNKELIETLKYLRLGGLLVHWDEYLKLAAEGRFSDARLLTHVLEEECRIKRENARQLRLKRARIPDPLVIETFPFERQPKLNKNGHRVVVWVSFGVLGLRNEIERAGGRAASQTARAPLRRRFV
jgi:hypothetical protein